MNARAHSIVVCPPLKAPVRRAAQPPAPPSALGRGIRLAWPIALLALVALFHAFTHVRVVAAGYRLARGEAEHHRLLAERDRLRLEVATLRAPRRIEQLARAKFGMAPPAPGTVVAGRAGVAAAGRAVRAGDVEDRRPAPAEPPSSPGAELALRGARGAASP
jgi:cell division protein FtsL